MKLAHLHQVLGSMYAVGMSNDPRVTELVLPCASLARAIKRYYIAELKAGAAPYPPWSPPKTP
jgi:hypothetical protein